MSQISAIVSQVISGQKTARQCVEEALAKADSTKEFHALLSLTDKRALERADEIDADIRSGKPAGRLAGVPFVAKDNFLAFGAPTTAAAKILENFEAPIQATAIEKLEAEGAICIGKANLDAFAHGGSTENSAYGVTHNAFDQTRVAGGSSGGSAVVTALDVVPFALGTDTGGSIRQPASFNGVYGMKPTYGAVSRYGVVAMASSTDTIGCFAQSSEDVRLVMDVMAGKDKRDMTTIDQVSDTDQDINKLRIGVIAETMTDDVQPTVRQAIDQVAKKLTGLGHKVDQANLPMMEYALAIYYIVVPAEITSNLARYDGVRFGRRAADIKSLVQMYGHSRNQGFVTENKRRIMIGSYVLSSGYFDAYYLKAQKARTLLINQYNDLFEKFDILLTPTAPTTAFGIGENSADPIKMYLADIMTVPPSLAGLPALSVPVGKDENGLPIGAQLIAPRGADGMLLSLAKQLEQAS
ncbi:Asp-tRNA(Asn)/Glu-tRNA(Gln) amidotransferase subunit GatA [Candidatus Saccharibacteria bacterium]|nr:Asp-tRNA(Asn)/Glu-tRNA(Gln) amidotransferase subunit GatA [Candidatus Saccharibacteria bacterium]